MLLIHLSCTNVFKAKWGSDSDINALYQDDCSKTEKISSGLHVVINLLSTLLLGASNLRMQLLAAPTRSEIDRAHQKFVWRDIGVPSIRNLKYIGRERLLVYAALGISSVPLHFLYVKYGKFQRGKDNTDRRENSYNSAVFPTLASNSYDWLVVTPGFLNGALWDLTATNTTLQERGSEQVLGLVSDTRLPVMQRLAASTNQAPWPTSGDIVRVQNALQNGTGFTRLSPLDCLQQYSTPFGGLSNIVLITLDSYNTSNANNSVLACGTQSAVERSVHKGSHPGEWMCRLSNTSSCKKLAAHGYESEDQDLSAIAHWNVVGYEIEYCMASYRPTGNRCGVVYSYRIMVGK